MAAQTNSLTILAIGSEMPTEDMNQRIVFPSNHRGHIQSLTQSRTTVQSLQRADVGRWRTPHHQGITGNGLGTCAPEGIPAVGPQVGNHLLSVMHNHSFQSAEQLAVYLGLVSVERQSGPSIQGRPRLSKAGAAKTRAVLYMAAIVATKHNPHVKALYLRLQGRGKTKMSALGVANFWYILSLDNTALILWSTT